MIGIYKITSPSNKVYIGQSRDIKKRWSSHKRSGKTTKLYSSFRKYGVKYHNFEVIHELKPYEASQKELDRLEQYYMDMFRESGFELLNIKEGGMSARPTKETIEKIRKANTGRKCSEETKKKLSKINSGKNHPKYGTKHSAETKKKMSEAKKGKKLSKEHKEKLSKVKKELNLKPMLGKKHTQETKDRISKSMKGVKPKPEHVKKRAEAIQKWWNERRGLC